MLSAKREKDRVAEGSSCEPGPSPQATAAGQTPARADAPAPPRS